MKIEALESIKADGYILDAEDVKTVPDEVGAKWCALGWARDMAGEVPTGERQILNARLVVDRGVLTTKASTVGEANNG
jgi:hypothetical protein